MLKNTGKIIIKIYDKCIWTLKKRCRFIVRVFRWIHVLWKQEDWDYEYLYDIMEFKMKEIQKCLKKDKLHPGMDRHVRQISICLAYLERYRNFINYIDFPEDGVTYKPADNGLHEMIFSKELTAACEKADEFEKFNYEMFWKRFRQWHQTWWC